MSTSEKVNPVDLAPHSQEAEEAVLGSLLMNPELYHVIAPTLNEGDFFFVRHGWIYAAIQRCYKRDGTVDTRTLADELRTVEHLEEVGGESYLNYLPTTMPTSLHGELYARLVERAAIRRRLLGAAGEIARLAHDETIDLETVITQTQQSVFSITNGLLAGDGITWFKDEASDYHDVAWHWKLGDTSGGMSAPLPDLDAIIEGISPGDVVCVAAAPGMGKTSLMLQWALHGESLGFQGLMYSMEMTERNLLMRIISQETGITTKEQKCMTDAQWAQFQEWFDSTRNTHRKMAFDKRRSNTAFKIAARCRQFANEYGLDFVVIDYLQLMRVDNKGDNRSHALGESLRQIKELAMEIPTRIIIGSQLSRDFRKNNRAPTLADLRDSGEIEEHCDKIVFIHAPDGYDTEQLTTSLAREAIVGKHRNGEIGTAPTIWIPQRVKFGSAARIELPDFSVKHGR
jgi:replicative DNA helicase